MRVETTASERKANDGIFTLRLGRNKPCGASKSSGVVEGWLATENAWHLRVYAKVTCRVSVVYKAQARKWKRIRYMRSNICIVIGAIEARLKCVKTPAAGCGILPWAYLCRV